MQNSRESFRASLPGPLDTSGSRRSAGESTALVPESPLSPIDEDNEDPRSKIHVVLALFTVLTVSVTSVTSSLVLVASQLLHHTSSPRGAFFAITGMQFITASLCGFLASFDAKFDAMFGASNAIHFRIITTSGIKIVVCVSLALIPNAGAQVAAAFLVCFLADAVLFMTVQFMAVLEPTSTAWVVLASYASNAFPIGVLALLQLDTGAEWSGPERLKFFAPPMALNLGCIVVFALAWPRAGVGPPVANPGTGFLRRASRGLATGIRRLDREEGKEGAAEGEEVTWGDSLAKLGVLAPAPYHWMTICGAVSGFSGLLVLPLIALVPTSSGQAALIMARLWGEVAGQVLATGLLVPGALKARVPDLVVIISLTVGRLVLAVFVVRLLIAGQLPVYLMFIFRACDQFILGSAPVMALQAAEPAKRRVVARTDLFWRNFASLCGLCACAPILAYS